MSETPQNMTTPIAPTCKQLCDEELELIKRESDDSYRHGSYVTAIYRRDEDGTFWLAWYRLSTSGDINELKEGWAKIVQVFPREKTVTVYETEQSP